MNKKIIPIALTLLFAGAMNAQVGVGNLNPDDSAQLDVVASDKGVLIPRVELSATNQKTPVANPKNSLLVFNTKTNGTGATAVTPGFYYWYEGAWRRLTTAGEATTTQGNTLLHGPGTPVAGTGNDGDFYIDTDNHKVYGPKTAGSWGTGTSMIGPQGEQGEQGPAGQDGVGVQSTVDNGNGTFTITYTDGSTFTSSDLTGPAGANGQDGVDGKTILNGTGAPTASAGNEGDFYYDTADNKIYGPKTASGWGTGTSLVGPQGPAGPAGPGGSTIVNDDNQVTTLVTGDGSNATPYKVEVRSALTTVSSDTTLAMSHNIVYVDASAGNVKITLPAPSAANKGKSFKVVKADSNEKKSVTVKTTASVELFNTTGNEVKNFIPAMGWEFTTDGTKWYITNKF